MSPSSARGIDFLPVFSPRIILINVSPHLKMSIAFLPGAESRKVEEKGRFIAGLLVQNYFYTGIYLGQFLRRGLQEHQTSDPYTFATENTSSLELRTSIPLTTISEKTIPGSRNLTSFWRKPCSNISLHPKYAPVESYRYLLWSLEVMTSHPAPLRERTAGTDTQD